MWKNEPLIVLATVLGVFTFLYVSSQLGDYLINRYGYNITHTDSANKHGQKVVEGLCKIKKIKYKKNEDGQLQVRSVDREKLKTVLEESINCKSYTIITKPEAEKIIEELKQNKLKYAVIPNVEKGKIFLLWEDL